VLSDLTEAKGVPLLLRALELRLGGALQQNAAVRVLCVAVEGFVTTGMKVCRLNLRLTPCI